jgi:hypothetical protein
MEQLFGQLRSILHDPAPPSAHTWRRLWRLIDRAPADYAAQQLVPYAQSLLDRAWPDHLRAAPNPWLVAIADRDHTPPGWPLVRTLRGAATQQLIDALSRAARLAHITTINTEDVYDRGFAQPALLRASGLTDLRHVIAPHSYDEPTLLAITDALLDHHAHTLQTLHIGRWGAPLPPRLARTPLPQLAHLDLHTLTLPDQLAHELLRSELLPSLQRLAINLTGSHAASTLRAATITRNLRSLTLLQGHDHRQTSVASNLLHALPDRPLDHLSLQGCFMPPTGLDTLLDAHIPAPRHLTLNGLALPLADRARLSQWSALPGVERLDLHNMAFTLDAVAPLICQPWAATLRRLDLSNCNAQDLPALLGHTLPALQTLSIDSAALRRWPKQPTHNALPSLTSLDLAAHAIGDDVMASLASAPWLPQLHSLRLKTTNTPAPAVAVHLITPTLAAMPHLHTLSFDQLGATASIVDQLCAAPMPALRHLDLGAPPDITPDHITRLCAAPWLGHLESLKLKIKQTYSLRHTNLRAVLRKHGLSRHASVRY